MFRVNLSDGSNTEMGVHTQHGNFIGAFFWGGGEKCRLKALFKMVK